MLRPLGAAEAGQAASRSSTGGSTDQHGADNISSMSSGVCVARKTPSFFSAAHLSTPKRLMSTAVGGGDPTQTGDIAARAGAGAATAGDIGPDVVAGAADAAMAASTLDQV